MDSLPLSWAILNSEQNDSITISKWNINWLALQSLPPSLFNFKIVEANSTSSETIIRGCNAKLAQSLIELGYSSLQIGMEAVLHTDQNHFNKKSLKELIKRGLRHGRIVEIPYSTENIIKLKKFQKISTHGNEPQLQNLFQTHFRSENILYVFINGSNNWLGAILVSRNSTTKLHTELILRKADSPNGIMEALIHYVFVEAKRKNIPKLSLGEVPFSSNDNGFKSIKSRVAINSGRLLNFAYNYRGLYSFKNKFQPNWEELYICTSARTSIKHLVFIGIYSNFHRLISYNLLYRLKNIFRDLIINKPYFFISQRLDFNKT